jgi:hypothetical protein
MYDEAASSSSNYWAISDYERHTREIQSVSCHGGIFAQDHTFEVVKNYPSSIGAVAVWDVAIDTGEIATAVLVPTTQTKHFSHAVIQLLYPKGRVLHQRQCTLILGQTNPPFGKVSIMI